MAVKTERERWGTGIRGLMRGMATLPQGNQELLVYVGLLVVMSPPSSFASINNG